MAVQTEILTRTETFTGHGLSNKFVSGTGTLVGGIPGKIFSTFPGDGPGAHTTVLKEDAEVGTYLPGHGIIVNAPEYALQGEPTALSPSLVVKKGMTVTCVTIGDVIVKASEAEKILGYMSGKIIPIGSDDADGTRDDDIDPLAEDSSAAEDDGSLVVLRVEGEKAGSPVPPEPPTPPVPPTPPAPRLILKTFCNDGTTDATLASPATLSGTKDSYEPGEEVTITIVPNKIAPPTDGNGGYLTGSDTTYTFLRWSDGSTDTSKTITMVEGDNEVSAIFDITPITSASDLNALRAEVAETANASVGKVYLQTADIDLSDYPAWEGIGPSAKRDQHDYYFKGAYNGGGHRITGLSLYQQEYAGLFGMVDSATIVDLSVDCEGFVIRPDFPSNEEFGGAVLMGYANETASAPVVLANITTTGTVGDASNHTCHNTAGMVARSDGPSGGNGNLIMISCRNEADVFTTRNSSMKMGGLLAYLINSTTIMRDCENANTLTTNTALGAAQNVGCGGMVGSVGAPGHLYIYGGSSNTSVDMPAGTTGYGSITGWMNNGSYHDGLQVEGNIQGWPNGNAGETGNSYLGAPASGNAYTILDSNGTIELNTDTVYKAFAPGAADFTSATSGDYIKIDTEFFKPTIKFNGAAASEEVIEGTVIKFYAA